MRVYGVNDDDDTVHKLAQTAHALATGKVGSGFDIAAATYGSVVYVRYSPDIVKELPAEYTNEQLLELINRKWDYTAEKFSLPESFRIVFANFVGEAMITTKAVGSVSAFKAKDLATYNSLIGEMNDENTKAIEELRNFVQSNASKFTDAFNKGRALLKRLGELSNVGIEPDDCTELIEQSNRNGALVCKLPGAGGKDAIAAICLGEENEARLRKFWSLRKELHVLDIGVYDGGQNNRKGTRRHKVVR